MKTWKRTTAAAAVALMASAALAACGDAPDEDNNASEKSDFLPCILSDAGGFDDKSFNQLSYEGVQDAAEELGSEYKEFESKNENDYAPALENFVAQGCDAIVTVVFALSAATVESAKANGSKLTLLTSTVPLVAGVLGLVALVAGILLALAGRRSGGREEPNTSVGQLTASRR